MRYHTTKKGQLAECKAAVGNCPLGEHIEAGNLDEAVVQAADDALATAPTIENGPEIYVHPQGKQILVNPDGSLTVTKDGLPSKSGATLDDLRSGRGAWKRADEGATVPSVNAEKASNAARFRAFGGVDPLGDVPPSKYADYEVQGMEYAPHVNKPKPPVWTVSEVWADDAKLSELQYQLGKYPDALRRALVVRTQDRLGENSIAEVSDFFNGWSDGELAAASNHASDDYPIDQDNLWDAKDLRGSHRAARRYTNGRGYTYESLPGYRQEDRLHPVIAYAKATR